MTKPFPAARRTASFTVVEVMMATLVLMVGFIGLIEAVTVTANTMDYARRQTLATQIISHEIEKLWLLPWDVTAAAPNELCIHDLPAASTAIAIDSQFDQARLALGDNKSAPDNAAVVRFKLTRTVTNPDPVSNIREVNFIVTWVVTTSRRDASGNPVKFTHTCASSAWYGKYGLHLSYRQS